MLLSERQNKWENFQILWPSHNFSAVPKLVLTLESGINVGYAYYFLKNFEGDGFEYRLSFKIFYNLMYNLFLKFDFSYVRKSQKQFTLFSYLPKNERNNSALKRF